MEVNPIDKVWTQTKRLNFRNLGTLRRGGKVRVFMILSRRNGSLIGHARWNHLKNGYEVDVADHKNLEKYEKDLQSFCEWATIEFYKVRKRPKKLSFRKRRANRIRNLLSKPDGGGLDKRYAPVVK